MESDRVYIAIDLKSYYASVECVDRGLDPLDANLVVADESRTQRTICLAVSPPLKARGVGGRPRLFEVVRRVRDINYMRCVTAPGRWLTGKSVLDSELQAHPDWEVDFVIAPPRMAHYIECSARIYQVYLRYVAPEDIHVYSVDEVFIDATGYLRMMGMDAHQMAMTMVRDVLRTTGITATAGIGSNMYLCKVAMDIVAKKMAPDADGVRVAQLDEMSYRRLLWDHEPLTDFWRVGSGIQRRLARYGMTTMGDIARASLEREDLLYQLFGVNAELLIDHAWGWEPTLMEHVKAYRPQSRSLCSGQVLASAYDCDKARVVVQEMAEGLSLDLLDKGMATDHVTVAIGYDSSSLEQPGVEYEGPLALDHYGRVVPHSVHASTALGRQTCSMRMIREAAAALFDRIADRRLLIRRLSVVVSRLIDERVIGTRQRIVQLDLFTDYEALERQRRQEQAALDKERRLMQAALALKKRFGKNSLLKGLNLQDGATARERNQQIGGHKA